MTELYSGSYELALIWLVLLVVGVGVLLRWVWHRPASKDPTFRLVSDSGDVVVTPRPVLSSEEATLFNLVKLAVQDHFLVLGKLSVLQLVSFPDKNEGARRALMRSLQPVRLDMVLVHPGTLQAQIVIKFRQDKDESVKGDERERLMETVLKAAEIQLVFLSLGRTYSVVQLAEMLGLAQDE